MQQPLPSSPRKSKGRVSALEMTPAPPSLHPGHLQELLGPEASPGNSSASALSLDTKQDSYPFLAPPSPPSPTPTLPQAAGWTVGWGLLEFAK